MMIKKIQINIDNHSSDCCYVAITDQATHQIKVFDLAELDWNSESSAKWIWSPNMANGFEGLISSWGLPTDVKIRGNEVFGGKCIVVTDSKGLSAVVSYPNGNRKWGLNVGGNPHSAELLPNGNIAIAASTGGWVRIYASSQGPDSTRYTEYALSGAHGVHWDPQRTVLWALGDDFLAALEVSGTNDTPEIREVHKVPLPSRFGHDLQPVCGHTDRLWVSTGSHVYQYVKSMNLFDEGFSGNEKINRDKVKTIGNFMSGQVVSTIPDGVIRLDGERTQNDWCTDTIDFYTKDTSRNVMGSAIYKARVWNKDYL